MLPLVRQDQEGPMSYIAAARRRVQQASGLGGVLDAAYDAFESMLSVIRDHEDSADGMFIPFVMAATCAANGRDAVLFAPSLPPRRLHEPPAAEAGSHEGSAEAVAGAVAALSLLLASQLAEVAGSAPEHEDRAACQDGARCAQQIHDLLTGPGP
jgi:hypothetical protein